MDNAGENLHETKRKIKEEGVFVELTSPHTPQMNGFVERSFVNDRGMEAAMLISEN